MNPNFSSDDFFERFNKFKNQLIRQTANTILESTIQFFSNDSRGKPTAIASGVLITLVDRFFLVTAAHVIAEDYNDIFLILPTKELRLGGELYCTPLPVSGLRKDDRIDIAVLELDEYTTKEILTAFKFITIQNIEIGHELNELQYYLSVGFPASKTKVIWSKNEIRAVPSPFVSEPEMDFEYQKFDLLQEFHIAVKFDGKLISEDHKNINKAPELEGISGSGLWFLKGVGHPDMITSKQLVGIVIEKIDKHQNKAIIATRIDFVTELIRQRFQLDITKSEIKINYKYPE